MPNIRGRCLCGAVAYEISGKPETAFYCHCSRCRRWTGSAVAALMVIQSDQLTVTKGKDQSRMACSPTIGGWPTWQ